MVKTFEIKGKNDSYIIFREHENDFAFQGKFSKIFIGKRLSDESSVIVKQLIINNRKDIGRLKQSQYEAELRFKHPNIAETLDYIEQNNDCFIIREYIEGIDLKTLMKRWFFKRSYRLKLAEQIALQILDALQFIHNAGVVHRDIKPANIFIEKGKGKSIDYDSLKIKLIDFGQAKINSIQDTWNKNIPFSLVYAPPEQVLGFHHLVDGTSDLYSLGITLYELIARETPYHSAVSIKLITQQITSPLPDNDKIPGNWLKCLQKACAKFSFMKPPENYSIAEVEQMLKKGIGMRFQQAADMSECIHASRI